MHEAFDRRHGNILLVLLLKLLRVRRRHDPAAFVRYLETAKAEQEPQDVLFVGGSNFLVADLLEYQSIYKL